MPWVVLLVPAYWSFDVDSVIHTLCTPILVSVSRETSFAPEVHMGSVLPANDVVTNLQADWHAGPLGAKGYGEPHWSVEVFLG